MTQTDDTKPECRRDRARAIYIASRWRANNRQKCRAIASVGYAIRISNIQRGRCERCNTDKFVCAFHNQGYDKPLDVNWRCRRCQGAMQRAVRLAQEKAQAISIGQTDGVAKEWRPSATAARDGGHRTRGCCRD
jgi:hypothetical protein